MSSHNLDFNYCANRDGFCKSSHLINFHYHTYDYSYTFAIYILCLEKVVLHKSVQSSLLALFYAMSIFP